MIDDVAIGTFVREIEEKHEERRDQQQESAGNDQYEAALDRMRIHLNAQDHTAPTGRR
ncbi:hypothetical protein [Sinorhizobium fredii]